MFCWFFWVFFFIFLNNSRRLLICQVFLILSRCSTHLKMWWPLLRSCVPGHLQGATNDPDHGSFPGSAWACVQGNREAEWEATPWSWHGIQKYPCWSQDCGMLSGGVMIPISSKKLCRAPKKHTVHTVNIYCIYCPFATSRSTDWVGFCALTSL